MLRVGKTLMISFIEFYSLLDTDIDNSQIAWLELALGTSNIKLIFQNFKG